MQQHQFQILTKRPEPRPSTINVLDCMKDAMVLKTQTLLYGYTIGRNTYHAYYAPPTKSTIAAPTLEVIVFEANTHTLVRHQSFSGEFAYGAIRPILIDNFKVKRLYPERCRYKFCKFLKEKAGITGLPFTTWSAQNYNDPIILSEESTKQVVSFTKEQF